MIDQSTPANVTFRQICIWMITSVLLLIPVLSQAGESKLPYDKTPLYRNFDKAYTDFSVKFLQALSRHGRYRQLRDINALVRRASVVYNSGRRADAIALILANTQLINNNINSKGAIEITRLLLQANEFSTAKHLLDRAIHEADPSVISNIQFAFARYYYARNNWQEVVRLVDKIANDLPTRDLQHALLMQGIALQNMKQHRKALAVYAKIPGVSEYYTAARINMAIANIRQDWWSDGYSILNKLLQEDNIIKNNELSDRINNIIGYSFLQQEYYRNSREAFRNVALNGAYTTQALLGIALDAAYQQDFVGALNAAQILRKKTGHDLQIDEANLLLPYFYEKLGQTATASAGYTDAIRYFESRLATLKLAESKEQQYYQQNALSPEDRVLHIEGESLDLGMVLPEAFFQQNIQITAYRSSVNALNDKKMTMEYARVQNLLGTLLRNKAHKLLEQKRRYLTDYMNQCRYGLARLYDSHAAKSK